MVGRLQERGSGLAALATLIQRGAELEQGRGQLLVGPAGRGPELGGPPVPTDGVGVGEASRGFVAGFTRRGRGDVHVTERECRDEVTGALGAPLRLVISFAPEGLSRAEMEPGPATGRGAGVDRVADQWVTEGEPIHLVGLDHELGRERILDDGEGVVLADVRSRREQETENSRPSTAATLNVERAVAGSRASRRSTSALTPPGASESSAGASGPRPPRAAPRARTWGYPR